MIAPDQRGYNMSHKPKSAKNYRISLLVDDIVGLIDAPEYEKVNLVGHDWSAAVAWMLANRYPERLHRLNIMNLPHPAVMRRFLMRDLEQILLSRYVFFFQLPWLPEAGMRRDNWRGAERVLRGSGTIHTFTNEDIEKYKEAWSQPGAMTAMINWYRAAVLDQCPILKDPSIKVPTLMMWGMQAR